MPVPSLIIGLGGTGTLVATYIKKELTETLDGKWPPKEVRVLSFDTDHRQPEIGGRGLVREARRTTGSVRLGSGEFFFIGGNVKGWMEEVVVGKHEKLRSWLMAEWYLQTLPDKTFNLNEGAGQFRQFGRLAVFKDLASPDNSVIYNTLNDALVKIRRDNPTLKSFQVFIVSSLAGGTGAGMVADVAHLIRKIAEQPNIDMKDVISLRGYLVLPDAFSRTIEVGWLRSMYARAYAAMRENRRFAVSFDYARGYPMHYHEGTGHPIWHGAIKGRLFDLLYYIDGQGERNPLSAVNLEYGVAPAVADVIISAIDVESGAAFASYVTNVEAERQNRIQRGDLNIKMATFGSVGTYSIVFPIYHVLEAWSHDLGLDALNQLLAPVKFDSTSGIPIQLASNKNQENPGEDGRDAAQDFLRGTKPVIYQYRDENETSQTKQAEPTLLFGELERIGRETKRLASTIVRSLSDQKIYEWEQHFTPRGDDRETQRLLQRVKAILDMKLYDHKGKVGQVQASNQLPEKQKEDPLLGCERLPGEARAFKNRYLGDEDPKTGRRSGGLYRDALARITEHHVDRFRLCLNLYLLATLNGSPNRPSEEAKGGKVGFLMGFLDGLGDILSITHKTMQKVQKQRATKGENRRGAIAKAQASEQAMKSLTDKRKSEIIKVQHGYLHVEQELTDILRVEATEDAVVETINQMLDYVKSAQKSLEIWIKTLASHSDSLYSNILRGRKQVDSDRAADELVKCRLMLKDDDYENARYQEYVSTYGGSEKLLENISWKLDEKMVAGRPKAEFSLNIRTRPGELVKVGVDSYSDNLALWLELCRLPFAHARRTESVIGYLRDYPQSRYRESNTLANLLYANSGVSLNISGGAALSANFVRAYFSTEEEAGHTAYLRNVMQELAQKSGQSVVETFVDRDEGETATPENPFIKFTNSEDRFKLTLIYTRELIELKNIEAYSRSGQQAYLGGEDKIIRGDRRMLHVFPAEVHAAEFESRLPELKQKVRLFSDDVALQLEDLDRFRLFLMCYVYDLIKRIGVRDEKSGGQRNVFALVLPPERDFDERGDPAQPDVIWLTHPRNQPPRILDAMMTFNFIEHDVRLSEDYVMPIKYPDVVRALSRIRSNDVKQLLDSGEAGRNSPDLRDQLEAIADSQARQELLTELARIDHIRMRREHMDREILKKLKDYLTDAEIQKEYDLGSVFALMLDDEIKSVRQIVRDRIRALGGLGMDASISP